MSFLFPSTLPYFHKAIEPRTPAYGWPPLVLWPTQQETRSGAWGADEGEKLFQNLWAHPGSSHPDFLRRPLGMSPTETLTERQCPPGPFYLLSPFFPFSRQHPVSFDKGALNFQKERTVLSSITYIHVRAHTPCTVSSHMFQIPSAGSERSDKSQVSECRSQGHHCHACDLQGPFSAQFPQLCNLGFRLFHFSISCRL